MILNVLPGGYVARKARGISGMFGSLLIRLKYSAENGMNSLGSNVGYDAIARMSPLFGSMTTIAPRLPSFARICSHNRCKLMSSVVMTLLPGTGGETMRSLVLLPFRQMSCSANPGGP